MIELTLGATPVYIPCRQAVLNGSVGVINQMEIIAGAGDEGTALANHSTVRSNWLKRNNFT
jgi:hypothetical protein